MPVIAIGAAIFAGSSIAAAGGLAAMFAANAFAAIAAVGAIASGIGVVTGNKALTQIGAVAGLAGGVGAFAQGQGWLAGGAAGGGADAAGTAMQAASDGAEAVSNTSQMIAAPAPGMVSPNANLAGTATAAADGTAGATTLAGDAASANGASGLADNAAGGLMNTPLSPLAGSDVGSFGQVASVTAGNTATSASIFDSMKGVGEFMNKNKDLTSMGLKFVQGMFDDTAAKKLEIEGANSNAQIGLYNARTSGELLNQQQQRQQMANMNAVPDLTGLKINPAVRIFNAGAPPVYNAPRAGLINSTGR